MLIFLPSALSCNISSTLHNITEILYLTPSVFYLYYNCSPLGSENGALLLQYKAIKSQGINTVDSKCLTPVDVAYCALISCSTLHLIVLS